MNVSTILLEQKIAAVMACLRRESTYESAAQQLGVSTADVQKWEQAFLAAGSTALDDSPDVRSELNRAETHQETNVLPESLLNACPDGIIGWDDSWRVILANPTACRLLDIPVEHLVGQRLDPGTNEDTKAPPQLVLVARALEQQRIELPGEPRRVVRCRNLQWQSEHASGYLTIIYDVTEQVALEAQREEMIRMVVHDLRGPLSSVSTSLNLTVEAVGDNSLDEALEILDIAIRSNDALLNMTNSLMDISKLEAGELKLELSPIDVCAMCDEVTDLLLNAAQAAEITLSITCEPGVPFMVADRDLMWRALTNLVDNALKFTPDGGQVEVRTERDGQHGVRLSVLDSGSGIPEAFRETIFEKYVQVPGLVGRRRGTGLGLAFCKLIVAAHHGQLWVEARPEGGSSFILTIPGPGETSA